MKEKVTVRILDQEYQLLSEEPSDHVQKVADFLDEKLREVKGQGGALSEKKLAILAAFHIASDYFQLLEKHRQLLELVRSRTEAMLRRIGSNT
ncbi:MAG: cell division protein ZapA [Deltaproteobacteria bacterium]|nr:MAG: cell division protein ZapA [Deltaproteobacteria bacterium]RLB86185.1 MAG: cell division protein ZapA [Deltaproteobacteria bacterium]